MEAGFFGAMIRDLPGGNWVWGWDVHRGLGADHGWLLVYLKEKFTIKEICAMVPFLLRPKINS